MARTQEGRRAETRSRLLNAAADQFARHGFHGVSAEAVADAADRTTGALYSHFGGKEGLLFCLVDSRKDAAADAIIADLEDPLDLDALLTAIWAHVTSEPDGHWLLLEIELWLHGARDEAIGRPLGARYATIRHELADAIEQWAIQTRTSMHAPATVLGAMVLALLLGAAMQQRLDPTAVQGPDVIAAVHRLISN